MLYAFALSNYKSFDYGESYGNHYFDMSPFDLRSKQNHINSEGLLKSAVLFGSNASGKSNLIDGLRFVKSVVTKGCLPKGSGNYYCYNHDSNLNKPISFLFQILVKTNGFLNNDVNPISIVDFGNHIVSPARTFVNYEISLNLKDNKKGFHIVYESLDVSDGRDSVNYCKRYSEESIADVEGKISSLKYEIRDLSDRISDLQNRMGASLPSDEFNDEDNDLSFILSDSRTDVQKQLQEEIESLRLEINSKRYALSREIAAKKTLRVDQSFLSYDPDVEDLKSGCNLNESVDINYVLAVIKAVYHWFDYTLEIIDPYGFVLPELDTDSFVKISEKVKDFDVNISRIGWVDVFDESEISHVLSHIHPDDVERILKCYHNSIRDKVESSTIVGNLSSIFKFSFWRGERSVKKLVTYHGSNIPHDLAEESDGTKRIIELLSILINQSSDKVYVVDELDRRLHPLLTKLFMDLFLLDSSSSSDNKQLIITTHESRLLTTKMFRADEIWFMDRDEDGCSTLHRASELGISFDKKLDKIYLEDGLLGGIPSIRGGLNY